MVLDTYINYKNKKNSNFIGKLEIELGYGIIHLYKYREELKETTSNNIEKQDIQEFVNNNVVSVLCIPSYMSPSDFVKFLNEFKDHLTHIRLLK